MSLRSIFGFIALAAVAAATWLWSLSPEPERGAPVRTAAGPAGYYLRGARLLGADETGHIS